MKIFLLIILIFSITVLNAQTLRDSLFGGKLKADTVSGKKSVKQVSAGDTIILIDIDTTLSLREKNRDDWKRFFEMQAPTVEPDKKKGTNNGQFKVLISFVVEPDGTVTFIRAECDVRVEFLESQFRNMFKKAPRLIPSHRGNIYVRLVRNIQVIYTIDKRTIDIKFALMNSLKE